MEYLTEKHVHGCFFYLSTIVSSRTGRTAGTSGANGTGSTALTAETSVTLKEKIGNG